MLGPILSPAKINLFLHVIGREAEGYHQIQSVFVTIDWCDVLHFKCRSDGQIYREDLTATLPAQDLTVQAARLLQKTTGTQHGVKIAIEKNIPMQAGLGGGSSNAAMTLLALNQLWGLQLGFDALHALAKQLGSDVPFFLHGGPAWVEGRGEQLTPLNFPSVLFDTELLVVKPPKGVATQQVFNSPSLVRDTPPASMGDFQTLLDAPDQPEAVFGFGRNDLQPVAMSLEPQIGDALSLLNQIGAQHGRMTGSGSAVFGVIDENNNTVQGNINLPLDWKTKRCKILDLHQRTSALLLCEGLKTESRR